METKQNKIYISRRHLLAGLVATGAGLSASFATAQASFAATEVFAQNPTPQKLKATMKQSQVAFKHQKVNGKSGRAPFKSYTLKTNTQAKPLTASDLNATFTAYPVNKLANPLCDGITPGHDGSSFWFADQGDVSVCKMTTQGAVTQYPLPLSDEGYLVIDITTGPGDTYWFTYFKSSTAYIGRLVGGSGQVTLYLLPDDFTGGSALSSVVAGLNNTIWFSSSSGKIGSITPNGAITTFALSGVQSVNKMISGTDGAIWFTFYGQGSSNGIGRLTASGDYTSYSMPLVPQGIAAGRHNDFWFTASESIGRMTTGGQLTTYQLPSDRRADPTIARLGNETFVFGAHGNPGGAFIGTINTNGDLQLFGIPNHDYARGITSAVWTNTVWFTTGETIFKFRVTS